MFDVKKISLDDRGVEKSFTVSPLAAIPAMKLIREMAALLTDTELIKSVVLQQFLQNFIQSGQKIEGVDDEQLRSMAQMDTPSIITYLIQSIIRGLDDNSMESLINKCMSSVIYHNGSINYNGVQALEGDMIKDFAVVMALVYEVFLINFSGAIDRLKKLLGQKLIKEKTKKS